MSRLDELPPDQRAVLSLLLRQRKSYAEVALLLGIAQRAVHDRAHAALAVLAPREARGLDPERRDEVGDYLLGQAGVAERLRTRSYLAGSEPARGWAKAISGELEPLADRQLAEIPAALPAAPPSPAAQAPQQERPEPPAPAGAREQSGPPPAAETQPPALASPRSPSSPGSSRLGGALLLAAIVVAVVVAVILLSSGGGGGSHSKTTASTKATGSSAEASKAGPKLDASITLHSPASSSHTTGVIAVLSEKTKRAFFIEAQHLPATNGFFYAVWLYNSPTSAEALSRAPAVGATHKLSGGAALPSNAAQYREILLTRETSARPTHPGQIVLRGAFSLGG